MLSLLNEWWTWNTRVKLDHIRNQAPEYYDKVKLYLIASYTVDNLETIILGGITIDGHCGWIILKRNVDD